MNSKELNKEMILDAIGRSRARLELLGISNLGLFGSFVRGEQTEQSDVDLLVEFGADKKNFDNFMDACFFLEELFGRKVELVTAESLSPYIKPHVMKEVEYIRVF
ncbi:MAG: nucleotidyltransferase family protein [Sedimentisphaerales bacterium]|nr:nucleotidyltransferase family protein [Sedimentisphaerales bacterium]